MIGIHFSSNSVRCATTERGGFADALASRGISGATWNVIDTLSRQIAALRNACRIVAAG